ncbi:hypothetical protein C4A75_05575 [Brevibacillus laterosporus]|nr:RHS repeat-associated core domain-containing protein [Brevibacillus laterosporus]PPA86071.1 hypothetical protein C4A75_05575 [Brevibacillus laterosporus]
MSNPFLYVGEVYDEESGLIYLRARYYDPNDGRFITEDTYKGQVDNPLSLNRYSYVYNNPIRFDDPTGNIPTPSEAANMAEQIYNVNVKDVNNASVPGGWKLIDIKFGTESMKMGVYSRVKADGTIEYSLVNKGTTPTSTSDWKNNGQQLFGSSTDMLDSIAAAKYFVKKQSRNEITMIGHSKGGAEAAANAVATNKNSIIFNPATVNLEAYGLSHLNYSASMTAFIVKGDILNSAEGWFSKPIDTAVYLPKQHGGTWKDLWITGPNDGIKNHAMDAVKKALKEAGYN